MNGDISDTGQPGWCTRCRTFVEEGPDACLGLIPGVSHACCGHGSTRMAYVVLGGHPDQPCTEMATVTLNGAAALAFFALVEEGQHEPAHGEVSA